MFIQAQIRLYFTFRAGVLSAGPGRSPWRQVREAAQRPSPLCPTRPGATSVAHPLLGPGKAKLTTLAAGVQIHSHIGSELARGSRRLALSLDRVGGRAQWDSAVM